MPGRCIPTGKWQLVLLVSLLGTPRRNGELRRLVPSISPTMLTQQRRELQADGIIVRTVWDQIPPHVVYAVSERDRDRLDTLLAALCHGGTSWCQHTGAQVLTPPPDGPP